MKKIHYIIIGALTVGMSLVSCSDFLEAENKSAGGQTAADYFKTPEGLKSWRVNTFNTLKSLVTSNSIYENS